MYLFLYFLPLNKCKQEEELEKMREICEKNQELLQENETLKQVEICADMSHKSSVAAGLTNLQS